jgi:hypothetical protein
VREGFLRHVKADFNSTYSRQTLVKSWRSEITTQPSCRHTRKLIRAADAIQVGTGSKLGPPLFFFFSFFCAMAPQFLVCWISERKER